MTTLPAACASWRNAYESSWTSPLSSHSLSIVTKFEVDGAWPKFWPCEAAAIPKMKNAGSTIDVTTSSRGWRVEACGCANCSARHQLRLALKALQQQVLP